MSKSDMDKLLKESLLRATDTLNLSVELKAAMESGDEPRLKKVQKAIKDRLEMYEREGKIHHG